MKRKNKYLAAAGIVTLCMILPDGNGNIVFNSLVNKFGNEAYRLLSSRYQTQTELSTGSARAPLSRSDLEGIVQEYHTRVAFSDTVERTPHPYRAAWAKKVTLGDLEDYSGSWWWPVLEKAEIELQSGDVVYERVAQVFYDHLQQENPSTSPGEIIQFMYAMFSRASIGYKCKGFASEYIRRFEIDRVKQGDEFSGTDKFIHFVEGARMELEYGDKFSSVAHQLWEVKDLLKQGDGYYETNDIRAGKEGGEWAKKILKN